MDPIDERELVKIFKTSTEFPNRLIKREDKNHEFKKSFNMASASMYLKTIAAFANNEGGYIIFGVQDKPHIMLGLQGKALESFSTLPTEKLTQIIQDYFSSDIEWRSCVYEYQSLYFGIIYIYPAKVKPVICKKVYDCTDKRYSLKESDIYYRYGGKSERIKYPELQRIIDEKREAEEMKWIQFFKRAAKIGVDNACIIDVSKGEISDAGGKIVIDEELLKKISFIKEGEFVEKGGTPTLRLIGDVQTIETGKMLVTGTRKIIQIIEQTDIIESFLKGESVQNPIDYIKRICSSTSGYLPVYHYLKMCGKSKDSIINELNSFTFRGKAKKTLLARLRNEKVLKMRQFPTKETAASKRHKMNIKLWMNENIPKFSSEEKNLSCVEAIQFLTKEQILQHQQYIKAKLLSLYKAFYEASESNLAQNFRTTICYLDEVINKEES